MAAFKRSGPRPLSAGMGNLCIVVSRAYTVEQRDQWEGNPSMKVTKLSVRSRFINQLMEVELGKDSLGMGFFVHV
jgi:hypothetical protein